MIVTDSSSKINQCPPTNNQSDLFLPPHVYLLIQLQQEGTIAAEIQLLVYNVAGERLLL